MAQAKSLNGDDLAVPYINLNGTAKTTLIKEAGDAYYAARNLEKALEQMTVHGRDYEQGGNTPLRVAQAQHRVRLQTARNLVAELAEYIQAIDNQHRGSGKR